MVLKECPVGTPRVEASQYPQHHLSLVYSLTTDFPQQLDPELKMSPAIGSCPETYD